MEREEDRPGYVRHQRIAESDLRRTRPGTPPGMLRRDDVDLGPVDLAERHQIVCGKPGGLAPLPAHLPGVVPVARRTEADVARGASHP
jgi:hypothetical protein